MRLFVELALLLITPLSLLTGVQAQTANVRILGTEASVDVDLGGKINPVAMPTVGGLYVIRDNNYMQVAPLPTIGSPFQKFTIPFPSSTDPLHYDPSPKVKYKVILFGIFKDSEGKSLAPNQTIEVTTILTIKLDKDLTNCGAGRIRLLATTPDPTYNWSLYLRYLSDIKTSNSALGTLSLRRIGHSRTDVFTINNFEIVTKAASVARVTQKAIVCLNQDIPSTAFTAKLDLNTTNLPTDVLANPSAQEIAGDFSEPLPKSSDIVAPEKRKLERNLDLGLTLTSSVADQTKPATKSTPAITLRQRTTRGVMDLRYAPWINVLHPVIERDKWLTFLTPFYINANVATGPISKDTLSMNRVLLGLEGESRYYMSKTTIDSKGKKHTSFPVWHRFIYGFTHASDRDFKQDEFTGKIEYAPIFEALYKPYALNYYIDQTTGEPVQRWYGFTFKPKVGFELGRTYHRHNPAADLKSSDTVRRLYFGTDLTLNLTEHLTFSTSDTFYIRGETPQHRFRNYFKGQLDFTFRPRNNVSSGLFTVFERGQLAPFATPDVNSFRIGFRLLGDFCQYFCR